MIVIPMAGLSRRFSEAGYRLPKYMLPLQGRSVFAHAVASFAAYFPTDRFLFIARPVDGTEAFIMRECAALGMADFRVVMLDAPTAGQAETVERGLDHAGIGPEASLTIFNIDTFRPGFRHPEAAWTRRSDGYLEVFRGSGANWSYVRPAGGDEPLALETAEKRQISDLCCTGLYHFARADEFRTALAAERAAPSLGERYVAPLYNHLIAAGRRIHYAEVPLSAITFCGVPAEYEAALGCG
ncbi:MAG: glycosyltransferase family 2 protein [Rhodospirillales bacterium]|nr:glycosyltransferase family 2 protein [Rhodospirillales bacterium]MDE2198028.1 glycosyltransferase family 2 protein [Rhodospirillales bacterium]